MIEIKGEVEVESFHVPHRLNSSFKHPILFNLLNPQNITLTTFVTIDLRHGVILYYKFLTDENEKITENVEMGASHGLLPIRNGFWNYPILRPNNTTTWFRYVDLKNGTMKFYNHKDLGLNDKMYVSETSSFLPNGDMLIAFGNEDGSKRDIYSWNMKGNAQLLFSTSGYVYPPHHVMYHNGYIITTEFFDKRYMLKDTGKMLYDDIELENYLKDGIPEKILKHIKPYDLYKRKSSDFDVEDGEVMFYDMSRIGSSPSRHRIGFVPSHVEIKGYNAYISSHNFIELMSFPSIVYVKPAEIHKFKLKDNKIEKEKTFSIPTGFRYTAHKVFEYNNNEYVVTFGHPNKMIIIDTKTMELYKEHDVVSKIIPDEPEDALKFVNEFPNDHDNPYRMSTMEISKDGKFIAYFTQDYVVIYSMERGEDIAKIKFNKEKGYRQNTFHSDTLIYN